MSRLITVLCMGIFILVNNIAVHASVLNIANQEDFVEQLKTQKRLAVAVIDRTLFKEQNDIEKAISNLESILTIASNNFQYRLSKIGFASIDLVNLPEETRKELVEAMGGKLKKPVVFVLFEHGNLVDDGMHISEKDLFGKVCHVLEDIDDALDDAWGNYIEYALEKRERADMQRAQVAAKSTEKQQTQNEQPVYVPQGRVYYSYPFYRGNFIRGRGIKVGFGGNYWPRGNGYGPALYHY